MELEKGGEVNRAIREANIDELKVMTFGEEDILEVPEEFSSKLDNLSSFSTPFVVGNVRIDMALLILVQVFV